MIKFHQGRERRCRTDHRETIIVTIGDPEEETKRIESDMEKYLWKKSVRVMFPNLL